MLHCHAATHPLATATYIIIVHSSSTLETPRTLSNRFPCRMCFPLLAGLFRHQHVNHVLPIAVLPELWQPWPNLLFPIASCWRRDACLSTGKSPKTPPRMHRACPGQPMQVRIRIVCVHVSMDAVSVTLLQNAHVCSANFTMLCVLQ